MLDLINRPIDRLLASMRPDARVNINQLIDCLMGDTHVVSRFNDTDMVMGGFVFKRSRYNYLLDCNERTMVQLHKDGRMVTNPAIKMGLSFVLKLIDLKAICAKLS